MRTFAMILIGLLLAASLSFAQGQTAFSLEQWMKLDDGAKHTLVRGFIASAKQDNVTLHRSPQYYVTEIDALVANLIKNRNDAGLKQSLGVSLKTTAMMDCDWDSGKDPVQEAKAFFGTDLFEAYKQNYPDKYQRLLKSCPRPGQR